MNIHFPEWVTDSHCTGHTHRIVIHGRHGATFPTYSVRHIVLNSCASAEAAKIYAPPITQDDDAWAYIALGGEM